MPANQKNKDSQRNDSKYEPNPTGPGSFTWQLFGAHIFLLTLPEAFVLQAAHPVINAAVTTTNKYRTDPWGRARATMEMLWPVVYSPSQGAIAAGHRIREWHRPIKGIDKRGNKFHALDPEAYAWVHMTSYDAMLKTWEYFVAGPPTPQQRQAMYQEWLQMGALLGVDPRRLPDTEQEFWHEYERIIDQRLVDTEVLFHAMNIREFVAELGRPELFRHLPEPVWKALLTPPSMLYSRLVAATLPDQFRKKFSIHYSRFDALAFKSFAWTVRKTFPLLPEQWRYIPLATAAIRDARKRPHFYQAHSMMDTAGPQADA